MLAIALLLSCAGGSAAPEVSAPAAEVRLWAAGSAALGAFAGGALGAQGALLAGASLSGRSGQASSVPYYALPPAGAGAGAAVASVPFGARAAWAAGVAGLIGAGGAAVAVELIYFDATVHNDNATFVVASAAPAAAGALCAAVAAAVFAQDSAPDRQELDAPATVPMLP